MLARNRFGLLLVVMVLGVSLSFLVMGVFAKTQPDRQKPLQAADKIQSPQQTWIVFPPGDSPWYAQDEIAIKPDFPRPGRPVEICVEVINLDPVEPHPAELRIGVAPLGIGVPYSPVGTAAVAVPPGGNAVGCVEWVPEAEGSWGVEALLWQEGVEEPLRSLKNIDLWEPLQPGVPHDRIFPVGPLPASGTFSFTLSNILPGWSVSVIPAEIRVENPGEVHTFTLRTIPPPEAPLGSRSAVVDVEGFLNGEPIGGIRKMDNPPVPLHQPWEPFFAESEIHIWPYPTKVGEPTQICVELFNYSDEAVPIEVLFGWAGFGIGLPFNPINGPRGEIVPPRGNTMVCFTWVPPVGGHFCIQVELAILGETEYRRQFSQRNLDVAEPLQPGVPHAAEFMVGNTFNPFTNPEPVLTDIWLEPDLLLPGWQVELEPAVLSNMAPGELRPVIMTVTPPAEGPLPEDEIPILDVRALVDGEEGSRVIGGIRKVFRPPIPLHPFPDPPYAEREITVQPYPLSVGVPTEVCVELRNPTPDPQDVVVQFAWANFGIGIPFTPINGPRAVHLPPFSVVKECLWWVPPFSGKACLEVTLMMEGYQDQSSRLNLDVDEPLLPGVTHQLTFPVGNPLDHPVTITMGIIPHREGWTIELSADVLPNMMPGEQRPLELSVTPPAGEPLPPDEAVIVDVEAYAEGELIGGFRKIFRPPVPVHRPKDPIYAESEIFIHPYPTRAHEPTEIGVELLNPTGSPQDITLTFKVAHFGIGLPFSPVAAPLNLHLPPYGKIVPAIIWIPPEGGLWCIQVEIEHPGIEEIFYSQRNIDVGEPLEPLTPHSRGLLVGNPTSEPATITLGTVPHFADWGVDLDSYVLTQMEPGEVREVVLTVTPPQDMPADGDPIVDVEAYIEGRLIGGIRKIYRPPVPIHRPKDPVYAESEIGVDPYPVVPGMPTSLSVEVYNPTDQDRIVTATFSIAAFGIGLPFDPGHITPNPIQIFVPASGAARAHVIWEPPLWQGKFCVQVTLEMEGHDPIWSRRNIDVGEPLQPGVPHSMQFLVGAGEYTEPVTLTLGMILHKENWEASLSENVIPGVLPGTNVTVTLTVTPPLEGPPLGSGEPVVDIEAYVEGELLGGFRKMDIPPVPIHKPHEKGYAESEIVIDPYPPQQGEAATVSTTVQNTSDQAMSIELEFGWAKFGMGIPFTTTGMTPVSKTVILSPMMTETVSVDWVPELSGYQCVIVHLSDPEGIYEAQESQRNVEVVDKPPCGEERVYTFTVRNDTPFTATVDLGLITFNVPADWQISIVPSGTLTLGPFSEATVEVHVTIPCPASEPFALYAERINTIQAQAGSIPVIDVEGYIAGELVGGIELQFPLIPFPDEILHYMPILMR